jgi:hypothetical protein
MVHERIELSVGSIDHIYMGEEKAVNACVIQYIRK